MKIGVDITSIKKFARIKKVDYKYWSRVFSEEEWEYAFQDNKSREHLAGIFAVKEASMKAMNRIGVKNFRKFEILHGKNGIPKLNINKCKVSVSHDKNMAIAVVVCI